MVSTEKAKTWSDIIVSWVSLIGVAAAVMFGFSEYRASVKNQFQDTERATLEFIARYNQNEMLVSQRRLTKTIRQMNLELSEELRTVRSQALVDARGPEFFAENIRDKLRVDGTYADAQLIVRFFDQIWVCIDVGLCDRKSAERFFTDEAYQYHFVLASEILRIQKTRPRYGVGLQQLRLLEQSQLGKR